ncbi:hypothetical protein NQ774_08565 [Ochrobactrum sp. BD61]
MGRQAKIPRNFDTPGCFFGINKNQHITVLKQSSFGQMQTMGTTAGYLCGAAQ